jgi:hypothetical protein
LSHSSHRGIGTDASQLMLEGNKTMIMFAAAGLAMINHS